MNIFSYSKSKWKKKPPNRPLLFPAMSLFFLVLLLISYPQISNSFFSISRNTLITFQSPQCPINQTLTQGHKFLWYAPHSGFGNQFSELKNAILMASILNRTLVVPPILDHHAIALGSCPKFRVLDPKDIRLQVWNHSIELLRGRRYVSIADIVDLSPLLSSLMVKIIDFRVFAMLWCGIDEDLTCFDASEVNSSVLGNFKLCGSLLSGMYGNIEGCLYVVDKDCRTTVWTYQLNTEDDILDSFQPDEQLRKKKKISYIRRRRDVYKALGPGSEAGLATVLAFGSLFTSPYKGSELSIDIHDAPSHRIKSLFPKLDSLSFVPEITSAGKDFAVQNIKAPFLCTQLRLLDGQFKNHWKSTFLGLEQKLESLKKDGPLPIHIFVMTDLPKVNWTNSYLGKLARESGTYRLHTLQEMDELVMQTAKKIANSRRSLRLGAPPRNLRTNMTSCQPGMLPDILLYMEETICSCASLGFVGTSGSTIMESIELMRKNNICMHQVQT